MTTTARVLYRLDREEVEEAVRGLATAPTLRWECSCGCGCGVVYARDARALWVASEVSAERSIRIVGLETETELDEYLKRLTSNRSAEKAAECVAVFTAAFAGKPS